MAPAHILTPEKARSVGGESTQKRGADAFVQRQDALLGNEIAANRDQRSPGAGLDLDLGLYDEKKGCSAIHQPA